MDGSEKMKDGWQREDEGWMASRDCQVVLRGHQRISARRINWTVCGATNSADHKRQWIQFIVSNYPVSVTKDHGYLIFPKEHIFVDCEPLNMTRVAIVHKDPSSSQPCEQLSQSQRTAHTPFKELLIHHSKKFFIYHSKKCFIHHSKKCFIYHSKKCFIHNSRSLG